MNLLGTHDTVRILTALVDDFEGSREEYARRRLSRNDYDLAQERGLPVNIHPGSGVEDICRIAENFPELKIVIAHPGEKPSYMEKLAAMKKFKNIHLDLSGTGIFRWGMLQYGVKEVGAERFLYGSDFPVCSPMTNLAGIKAEKLAAADEKLIISENFRRLTGL